MRRELRHCGVVPGELGAKCIAELVRAAEASEDMTVQLWAAGIEPVPDEMRGVRHGAEFIWNARGVAGMASTILNNPDKPAADKNLERILGQHRNAGAARSSSKMP
jgi:hypothetical protein